MFRGLNFVVHAYTDKLEIPGCISHISSLNIKSTNVGYNQTPEYGNGYGSVPVVKISKNPSSVPFLYLFIIFITFSVPSTPHKFKTNPFSVPSVPYLLSRSRTWRYGNSIYSYITPMENL